MGSIRRLDTLKNWSKLTDYQNKTIKINRDEVAKKSELNLILANSSIKNWHLKYDEGLKQYTPENCARAHKIVTQLIENLEGNQNYSEHQKIELIRAGVIQFNDLNASLDYCFIETGEREELCELFDNIADAVGIDNQNFEDGIASEWRDW